MKRIPVTVLVLFISVAVHAEKIAIKANDCGPLARGELGVVFHTLDNGKRQTYFAKGKAHDICPKIMNSITVTGYELGLCERNKPETPNECFTIKEFVILSYQNE